MPEDTGGGLDQPSRSFFSLNLQTFKPLTPAYIRTAEYVRSQVPLTLKLDHLIWIEELLSRGFQQLISDLVPDYILFNSDVVPFGQASDGLSDEDSDDHQ